MLLKMRDYANARIRQIRWNQRQNRIRHGITASGNKSEGKHMWVPSDCIAPHIDRYLRMGSTMEALAARANCSHKTIKNIKDGLTKWTREDVADRLMMAMELPHIELPVVKIRPTTVDPPPSQYYEE